MREEGNEELKNRPRGPWSHSTELKSAAKRDDRWVLLFEKYRPAIKKFVGGITSPTTSRSLDDLTNNVIHYLVEKNKLDRYEDRPGASLRSWLMTSINNYVKDQYRTDNREKRGGNFQHVAGDECTSILDGEVSPLIANQVGLNPIPQRIAADANKEMYQIMLDSAREKLSNDKTIKKKFPDEEQFDKVLECALKEADHTDREEAERVGLDPDDMKSHVRQMRIKLRKLLFTEVRETIGPHVDTLQELLILSGAGEDEFEKLTPVSMHKIPKNVKQGDDVEETSES